MAIVTGAKGGLRRGIALQLAGRGCIVAALDISADGRRGSIEEIAAGVVWLPLDAPDYVTAGRLNLYGGLDRD